MKEELDRIISEINSHKDWSTNLKMRYAYIKLGQLVHKDIMFFYTIQKNLLSKEKEDIRYPLDEIKRLISTDDLFDYKVVCKNSADMLVYIFKNCGIEAEVRKTLVYTEYENYNINHYFVIATGDEGKKYFMTLNPDLPNIKIGRKTSKFAYEIKYIIDNDFIDGGKNYGKQYYEGDEVDFSILSDEQIRELDEQIGYISNDVIDMDGPKSVYTDYFFDLLKKAYENNGDYIDFVCHKTIFYEIVSKMLNNNMSLRDALKEKPSLNRDSVYTIDFKASDISSSTWEDLKSYIINSVISKIYKEYKISSEVDFEELLKEKKYKEIRNICIKDIQDNVKREKINKLGDLNPLLIIRKMIELFEIIDELDSKKKLSKIELDDKKIKFFKWLNKLSYIFADKRLIPNEGSLSSTYLTSKLLFAFETIFDVGHKNPFNDVDLAEQVTIIKELLEIVLSDIKKDDELPNYDYERSPLRNRIISTVIFEKITRDPYYLIYVKNTKYGDNANVLIVYDLKENKIYLDKSPIDIMSDYYVIKDADMRLIVEEFTNGITESNGNGFNL